VQTMVYRLEAKKALRCTKRIGKANIFEAAISRKAAQGKLIDELLSLFGGKPVTADPSIQKESCRGETSVVVGRVSEVPGSVFTPGWHWESFSMARSFSIGVTAGFHCRGRDRPAFYRI
jgi:hypothetical protein